MPTYRVKVKTVQYDWMTVKASSENEVLEVIEDDERFPAQHEAAWASAEAADGPEDGQSIVHIMKISGETGDD